MFRFIERLFHPLSVTKESSTNINHKRHIVNGYWYQATQFNVSKTFNERQVNSNLSCITTISVANCSLSLNRVIITVNDVTARAVCLDVTVWIILISIADQIAFVNACAFYYIHKTLPHQEILL